MMTKIQKFKYLKIITRTCAMIIALGMLLVGAIGIGAFSLPSVAQLPGKTGQPDLEPLPGVPVQSAHLFPGGSGFALTTDELLWTTDYGQTWEPITPIGTNASDIIAESFLANGQGWLAVDRGADGLNVLRRAAPDSDDWLPSSQIDTKDALAKIREAGIKPQADLTFVDGSTGWLLVKSYPRDLFSQGTLFATEDGGDTWDEISTTAFGVLKFVSKSVGYLEGGPAMKDLYTSTDAGVTWAKAETPDLQSHSTDTRVLNGEPLELDGAVGIGVSWSTSAGLNNGFGVLISRDGGTSWDLVEHASNPDDLQYTSASVPGTAIIAVYVPRLNQPPVVWLSLDSGKTFAEVAATFPISTPPAAVSLSMADKDHLWLVGAIGGCRSDNGQDCFQSSGLFESSDGGKTWEQITLQ